MGFDADNELLQDFLVEAGELLEGLNQQLIDLEQSSDDPDLLNSVFRSFHTIKGGAGFLELDPLVEVCHRAEDVFNLLRNGERGMTTHLMDVMLEVLDVLNAQFASLQAGEPPEAAPESLLRALERLRDGEDEAGETAGEASAPEAADEENEPDLMASIEAARERDQAAGESGEQPASDEITDDEFEQLLDKLHGEGQHQGKPAEAAAEKSARAPADSDEISEDEFEQLLDNLHGEGKGPGSPGDKAAAAPAPARAEPPARKPESAPPGAESARAAAPPAKGDGAQSRPAKKPAQPKQELIRVDTSRLDAIMNLVGELVLVRNQLNTLQSREEEGKISKAIANLDMVTSDLQAAVMKTRMQPIKKVFGRFPRVIRDLSRQLGKEVNLVMEGEDTDLDKNLVEALADPLIHLVRNAVDHGIEMPDEREAKGKARAGQVKLSASQEGDHILLSISDDGKGMDPEKLRSKAVEKGLMDEQAAARMTEQECYEVILMPGFSTKDEISDISGRGVGMDVVKTAINKLSGTVDIDSEPNGGTMLRIKVPLTLAILPTLMVVVGGRKFAMPLGNISEIIDFEGRKINVVDGQKSINVRDRAVPIYHLGDWLVSDPLESEAGEADDPQAVLVQVGNQIAGLVVDRVLGQEEVVIKPLGELLHGVPGVAGATITGEGHIAMILDLSGLFRHYARGGRRAA